MKTKRERKDEQAFKAFTESLKAQQRYMEEVDKHHKWATLDESFLAEAEVGDLEW